jgi:uncharacterized protein
MSGEVFEKTLERIRRYCEFVGQGYVQIVFHGGEPCLLKVKRFDNWCTKARQILNGVATVDLGIQTNGTLLDVAWADAFLKHRVLVGISMDGPKKINDAFRVDHAGRGSYDQVEQGLKVLQSAHVPFGLLSVIQLGADPLKIHRHFPFVRP